MLMNCSIVVAFVCLFNTYSVPGYAVIMRIGWLAGIIGLNLCFSPTPRVGQMSNSILTNHYALRVSSQLFSSLFVII